MNVWTGTAIVFAGMAVLTAACSATPKPAELSPPPTQTKPPAPAPGMSWLRVAPQEGLRNATVTLDVACLDNLGPVHSPALDIGTLKPDPAGHQPWHLTGTATVHSDAAPGQYPITATCGAETLSAMFTVVPHP